MFRTCKYVLSYGAVFLALLSCNTSSEAPTEKSSGLSHVDSINLLLSEFVKPLGKPQPGEWRASFKEPYQSYAAYVDQNPEVPDATRNKIYLQPIGEFDSLRERIIGITAEYMSSFFNLEVVVNKALPSSIIPKEAQRMNDGQRQVLTGYIMNKILVPSKPADAAVFIAFTTFDLYPEESWNYVFGQASPKHKVGVWSLARYGDPYESSGGFYNCLTHTLKTATHETGHLFGIDHCTKNSCNMQGSNSLEESLAQPLWLCPECLCKLCYCLKIKEEKHVQNMLDFWTAKKEKPMMEVYGKMGEALGIK